MTRLLNSIRKILKEITFFRIFMLLLLYGWMEQSAYEYSIQKSNLNNDHMQKALQIWLRPNADILPVATLIDDSWQQICTATEEPVVYTLNNGKKRNTGDLKRLPFDLLSDVSVPQCIDRNVAIFQKKAGMFFLSKMEAGHE